jgi:hypothetical protein
VYASQASSSEDEETELAQWQRWWKEAVDEKEQLEEMVVGLKAVIRIKHDSEQEMRTEIVKLRHDLMKASAAKGSAEYETFLLKSEITEKRLHANYLNRKRYKNKMLQAEQAAEAALSQQQESEESESNPDDNGHSFHDFSNDSDDACDPTAEGSTLLAPVPRG